MEEFSSHADKGNEPFKEKELVLASEPQVVDYLSGGSGMKSNSKSGVPFTKSSPNSNEGVPAKGVVKNKVNNKKIHMVTRREAIPFKNKGWHANH